MSCLEQQLCCGWINVKEKEKKTKVKRYVRAIQFTVVIVVVVVGRAHTCLGNVLVVERQRRFADSIHLLFVFVGWDRGVYACGD